MVITGTSAYGECVIHRHRKTNKQTNKTKHTGMLCMLMHICMQSKFTHIYIHSARKHALYTCIYADLYTHIYAKYIYTPLTQTLASHTYTYTHTNFIQAHALLTISHNTNHICSMHTYVLYRCTYTQTHILVCKDTTARANRIIHGYLYMCAVCMSYHP